MNPSFSPTGRWGFCRRLDDGSGMSREAHVPFCEGLGVRFPRATHLLIMVDFIHRCFVEFGGTSTGIWFDGYVANTRALPDTRGGLGSI